MALLETGGRFEPPKIDRFRLLSLGSEPVSECEWWGFAFSDVFEARALSCLTLAGSPESCNF